MQLDRRTGSENPVHRSRPLSLFRKEAVESRTDRLHGAVNLALPISWQMTGGFLFCSVILVATVLATTTYARVEMVRGQLMSDRGHAEVVIARSGVVTALHVAEGTRVQPRQPLLTLSGDETLADGSSTQARLLRSLDRQKAELTSQSDEVLAIAAAERSRIQEEAAGLRGELAFLDEQIGAQRQLVSTARQDIETAAAIGRAGFISRRDLQARQDLLLARGQQLAQLQQTRAGKAAALAQTQRRLAQVLATARSQSAQLRSTDSDIEQRITSTESSRGYTAVAPIAGTVTAVAVRAGDHVTGDRRVMAIVPSSSTLTAELQLPTATAGFVTVGQEVRVAIDAFPTQRFGSIEGRIAEVSTIPIPAAATGTGDPVYRVLVALDPASVRAFGTRARLRPGMTLAAKIVTRRESFLEALFGPLIALSGD